MREWLLKVRKPSRYIGGEFGSISKPDAKVRIALAYPDLYEVGMSYLGLRILYFLINSHPQVAAERVFMPDADAHLEMKRRGVPLFTLESRTPLGKTDLVAFSLLYELNYTNLLHMLDLGGIPLRREERGQGDPIVGAGGPNVINPEPLTEFLDFVFFGDGEVFFERAVPILLGTGNRRERLEELGKIPGVYLPEKARRDRTSHGHYFVREPRVKKAILTDLNAHPFPEEAILPHAESVFDRQGWEISRGCPQKCRFCQATQFYSPFRARNIDQVANSVIRSLRKTGYEEVSFSSLSTADFPHFDVLLGALYPEFKKWAISVSLPSLRPSLLQQPHVLNMVAGLRKTSFTIVPEAGTERLRRVINKATTEEEIMKAAEVAFSLGWKRLKFYFMVGLPTEREEDLRGIGRLLVNISSLGRKILGHRPTLVASISNFVPMPWTPFQWEGFEEESFLREKQAFVLGLIRRHRNIRVNFHSIQQSFLEALLSRGDFRVGRVLERVFKMGGMLEAWKEHFRFNLWEKALEAEGTEPALFTGPFPLEEPLPWDHMEAGPVKTYLLAEREKALREERTPSCLDLLCGRCKGCIYWKVARKRFTREVKLTESLPPRNPVGRFFYRVYFTKKGTASFLTQTELLKTLERLFRRTATPLAFSSGFHPKPRISMGPGLPVGVEGEREVLEVEVVQELEEGFLERWNASSIDGLRFLSLEKIEKKEISRLKFALYWAPVEEEEKIRQLGFLPQKEGDGLKFFHRLDTPSPHRRAREAGVKIKLKRLNLYFEGDPQV